MVLLLLMLVWNFRLVDAEGFCALGIEGLVWKGCCFLPAGGRGGAAAVLYEYC